MSGRVHGVFFRASTARVAKRLGLVGEARNLSDGRVRVVACGDAGALDKLETWLHEGSPMARVDAVTRTDYTPAPDERFEGFVTG